MATATLTLVEDYKADPSAAGPGFARRQDGRFRPQPQPLHDGRRQLQAAQKNRRSRDRRDAAHDRRRGVLQLRLEAQCPEQKQQQQQQQQDDTEQQQNDTTEGESQDKNARVPAIQINWAQDSSRFSAVRRDSRKVKDLWVINALVESASDARDVPVRDAGRGEHPAVGDVRVRRGDERACAGQGRPVHGPDAAVATLPVFNAGGGRGGRGGGGAAPGERPTPSQWLSPSPDSLYITRLSRDMHKMDVCIADAKTGDVKPIIEERLNTYIESKPLRLGEQRSGACSTGRSGTAGDTTTCTTRTPGR